MGTTVRTAITRALDDDAIPYELADDHLRVRALAPSGGWVVVAQWNEPDAQLAVYCVSTYVVPVERRAAVMELLTRANFGLRLGCFELDLDDGELRFRCSVDFEGTEPSVVMAKALVHTTVATMGRYAPALVDVIDGAQPKDVLTSVERRP